MFFVAENDCKDDCYIKQKSSTVVLPRILQQKKQKHWLGLYCVHIHLK